MNEIFDYTMRKNDILNIFTDEDGTMRIIINGTSLPGRAVQTGQSLDSLSSEQQEFYDSLRQFRNNMAAEIECRPYMIFSNKTLIDMARIMPVNKEEMLTVSGVGEVKFEQYGQAFIDEIEHLLGVIDSTDATTQTTTCR